MDRLKISEKIEAKIWDKHQLKRSDVEECFLNRVGGLLEDSREEHKTDPATQWFIASNNTGKTIKVVFMVLSNGDVILKSAFEANKAEIDIYAKFGCATPQ